MTRRKPREVTIHTNRMAMHIQEARDADLEELLALYYFDEDDYPQIIKAINYAIAEYHLGLTLNPNHQQPGLQKEDRRQLLECLGELQKRLATSRIPQPLWEKAVDQYVPCESGQTALRDEINDLLARLENLARLFADCEIPDPGRTNPGKAERDQLVRRLNELFDQHNAEFYQPDFDEDLSAYHADIKLSTDRRKFLAEIMRFFGIPEEHIPKRK